MRKQIQQICLVVHVFVVAALVVSCGQNSTDSLFSNLSSASCVGGSCLHQNSQNLEIRVNSGGDYRVIAGLADFDLGGDCNEGAFPSNIIKWELYLDGKLKRHSGMHPLVNGQPDLSKNFHSACVDGRFKIYLPLYAISDDGVSRAGLADPAAGGARREYVLEIEVIGFNESGQEQHNSISRKKLFLVPI